MVSFLVECIENGGLIALSAQDKSRGGVLHRHLSAMATLKEISLLKDDGTSRKKKLGIAFRVQSYVTIFVFSFFDSIVTALFTYFVVIFIIML